MKYYLTVSLLLLSYLLLGQKTNDTIGLTSFNRGLDFYNKGELDSTLTIWTNMVENKIGKGYDTYANAFINIPTVYWRLKKYDKAREWYLRVLESDLRDNDETGSLMEPHTNYKHKSAVALAGLYEIDSNFIAVYNWLNKADTLYRYWGFEGSATNVSKEQAYLLNWKVATLLKLDKKTEAIRAIITELICSSRLESFFNKSEDQLLKLIDKNVFVKDFDSALEKLTIEEIGKTNWVANFTFDELPYKIPISNVHPDKTLPHYWTTYFLDKDQTTNKQQLIEYIKQRNFYRRIKS